MMNWDAIGAIGEILGAIAVVVTLLFLAKQLRENTASNKVATSWSMVHAFNDAHGEIFSDRDTAELASKLYANEELDAVEQVRVASMVLRHLNTLVAAHEAFSSGQLSELIWARTSRDAVFLTKDGFRPFLLMQLKLVPEETIVAIFGSSIISDVKSTPINRLFLEDES